MRKICLILVVCLSLFSCKKKEKETPEMLSVVTTTTMITDLVHEIGGDKIQINGLMGTGVDPHLYKASEGDVNTLFNADVIFYNGLHLEGKLEDIFKKMKSRNKSTFAVTDALNKEDLIGSAYFASNYDPHVWFNIDHWKSITTYVTERLSASDPQNAAYYDGQKNRYLEKLASLEQNIQTKISELPVSSRILVTAHDAFNYFGQEFNFQVVGLQGLSTASEAGVQDVQKLSAFIIKHKIKAIFVETSVPKRTIEALQASVRDQGHEVIIGGTLYSDALGNADSKEGTYIGMYEHNVNTIVNALK